MEEESLRITLAENDPLGANNIIKKETINGVSKYFMN